MEVFPMNGRDLDGMERYDMIWIDGIGVEA